GWVERAHEGAGVPRAGECLLGDVLGLGQVRRQRESVPDDACRGGGVEVLEVRPPSGRSHEPGSLVLAVTSCPHCADAPLPRPVTAGRRPRLMSVGTSAGIEPRRAAPDVAGHAGSPPFSSRRPPPPSLPLPPARAPH